MSTWKHQGKNRILDLPLDMRRIELGYPGQGSAFRRRTWGFHVTVYSCRFERLSRGRDEDADLRSQSTVYEHCSETIMKVGVSICAASAQVPVLLLSRLGWRYHRAEKKFCHQYQTRGSWSLLVALVLALPAQWPLAKELFDLWNLLGIMEPQSKWTSCRAAQEQLCCFC